MNPAPVSEGRFVRLRPACEDDVDLAHDLSTDPRVAPSWRFRGSTPSRADAYRLTVDAADACFVIVQKSTGEDAGLVGLYDLSLVHERVEIAMAHRGDLRGQGWPLEATGLAIGYAFATWNIQKVTALAFSTTLSGATRSGASRFFAIEATIPQVAFENGTLVDVHFLAVTREKWESWTARMRGNTDDDQ